MPEIDKDRQRTFISSTKSIINIAIVVCVSIAFLLVGMFVLDGDNGALQTDKSYWMQKFLSGLGSLLIMFSCANIAEETLKKRSQPFAEKIERLDEHYATVMQNGEVEALELFLTNKNKRNKYRAHLRKYKFLLRWFGKIGKKEKIKAYCENKLVMSPAEVWDMESPKTLYPKLTVDKLFAGALTVQDRDESSDINMHRMRYVLEKMLWKAIFIVGFGCYVPDLVYHFTAFTVDMIVPLIFKFVVILWAVYSGIVFGYQMLDRLLVVLKRKLVLFSEFRTRTDDDTEKTLYDRYKVEIEPDKFVENIKKRLAEEASSDTLALPAITGFRD